MSLVAYVTSDDSDGSDVEDDNRKEASSNQQNESNTVGNISDEDEYETVSSTSAVSSTLIGELPVASGSHPGINSTSFTSLEDLPAPQTRNNEVLIEEELEDEVKPKASELARAPKPPGKKKTVKITIPSLSETPEDGEEKPKKLEPSTKKSGLFSMLPAPIHSAKKEINRPLIPHTLTKKPVSSNKPAASSSANTSASITSTQSKDSSSKRMTPFNALTGYDSDSDEEENEAENAESSNFFSLDSSERERLTEQKIPSSSKTLQIEEVSSSKPDSLSSSLLVKPMENSPVANQVVNSVEVAEEKQDSISGPELGAVNDAPLQFGNVQRMGSWPGSSYGYLGSVGPSASVVNHHSVQFSVPSSAHYNLAHQEVPGEEIQDEAVGDEDLKKFMSDKEFQKLSGKRKRGLEEEINFVDANVDDYVDPSEVSKHLTEETEYVSHKSKDNLPTAQQRRKKQITYLAYQAKEREMELKNAWAQNRMTKKQTQSKYGF